MKLKVTSQQINVMPKLKTISQDTKTELSWQELISQPSRDGTSDYSANFTYLDQRISMSRKTITAGDVLKISNIADTVDDFLTLYSNLTPNSALIYNSENNYILNNDLYTAGDIVYSDIYGDNHHIKVQSSGFYYPAKLTQTGNTVNLTYKYSNVIPTKDSVTISSTAILDHPAQQISGNVTRQPVSTDYNRVYEEFTSNSVTDSINFKTITKADNTKQNIFPEIYYLYNNERIYFDENITINENNSNFYITNPTGVTISVVVR